MPERRRQRGALAAAEPSWATYVAASIGLAGVFVLILYLMGRRSWCECGFGLWTGEAYGEATSQHFSDPYSFTHVLHGMLFYWVFGLWSTTAPMKRRFLCGLVTEIGWEVLENSPPAIERYREATAALGYYGDSVLNALGDLFCCVVGFCLAARLPTKAVIALAAIEEIVLLIVIRDNLILNVIMLLLPLESIKRWQLGAR